MVRVELGVLLIVTACRKDVAVKGDAAGSGSGASCAAIIASYDSMVAAGGACKVDADCACFNGGVSPKHACGGVTDRATAAKLDAPKRDFDDGRCDPLMCAAWMCAPACLGGKCENGGAR